MVFEECIRFEPLKPQKVYKKVGRGAPPLAQFSHFIKKDGWRRRILQN